MGVAVRASDLRRGKWGSFRGENQQEHYLAVLQRNIDERPAPRYEVDEIVGTPKLGIRNITSKHYRAGSGWHYSFYTPNGMYTYKECQLMDKHEALFLQDVMKIIGAGG